MSRIGKFPIAVPKGVEVTLSAEQVAVKGPLGTLTQRLNSDIKIERDGDNLLCLVNNDSTRASAMSGTIRALVANMVEGVTKGFERKLTLVGVGYRAQAQGDKLNLALGFSHPVVHQMPKGVKVETPSQTEIILRGNDKQQVGQVAATIRSLREPDPYKNKGIRYAGEVLQKKVGKAGAAAK